MSKGELTMPSKTPVTGAIFILNLCLSLSACDTQPTADEDLGRLDRRSSCATAKADPNQGPPRTPHAIPKDPPAEEPDAPAGRACRPDKLVLPTPAPQMDNEQPGETTTPVIVAVPPEWPELRAWLEGRGRGQQ
jgi:hypothetical protein